MTLHHIASEAEFGEALNVQFNTSAFVASLPALESGHEPFLLLCEREMGDGDTASAGPGLNITVTNCLTGIFCKKLKFMDVAEVRQAAGMVEFSWTMFLKLLSAALRNEEGCSTTVRPAACRTCPATESYLELVCRFQLESVALVGRIKVAEKVPAPLPTLEGDNYLRDLRGFVVAAVRAAAHRSIPTSSQFLQGSDSILQTPAWLDGRVSTLPSANGAGTNLERGREHMSAASRSAHISTAHRKRAGVSMVDPHSRKARNAGSNPFQLSR